MSAPDESTDFEGILAALEWADCERCKAPKSVIASYRPRLCEDCRKAEEDQGDRARDRAESERSIPPVYRTAKFGEPLKASAEVQAKAKRMLRSPRVAIVGPAGGGKTTLGVAMMYEWLAATGRAALFVHADELAVARMHHKLGDGEPLLVDNAMRAPWLLIDDLGEGERDGATSPVATVIRHRHAYERPTWITVGRGTDARSARDALAALYGAGIVRRIFEGAPVLELGPTTPGAPRREASAASFDARKRASGDDS